MGGASTSRRRVHALAALVAVVVLTGTALGAATTDIAVSPASEQLDPGETTTVDVVVENADGGVGALNATVTLSNASVATVENVTLNGDPRLSNVSDRADGVEISAALADTDDSGRVTVATVVIRGERVGQTAVDVTVRALGDEDGAAYTVGSVDSPTITVGDVSTPTENEEDDDATEADGADSTPDGDDSSGDGTEPATATPTDDGTDVDPDGTESESVATDAPTTSAEPTSDPSTAGPTDTGGNGIGDVLDGGSFPLDSVVGAAAAILAVSALGLALSRLR